MINIIFLAFIIFLINGLGALRYFQIKDWLPKRVLADLYLPQGKNLFLNKKDLFLIIFSLIFIFWPQLSFKDINQFFLLFLLFILVIWRLKLIKKITLTAKAFILTSFVLFFNFLIVYLLRNNLNWILFFSVFSFQIFLFFIASYIFNFLVKPYLNYLGKRVYQKLKGRKIKKIIIVGSYGKSTTKELLAYLLSKKYKVLTPPLRVNHEYAVLKFLLNKNLEEYEFLVLELGSYYLGNIAWTTKFIKPDIVFITGITKQHYFLFDEKIENIIKGEGIEAIESMKEGKVFVNSNHEYFDLLLKEIKKENKNLKIITYGKNGDFVYKILENNLEKTIFQINDKEIFETNLIFPQQIENLTGVLSFVFEENLFSIPEIREIIKKIDLPETFLKPKIKENLIIFDDSYNANLRGILVSLDYFFSLPIEKKIIVFNGIFELGKETKEFYKKLKDKFLLADKVFLTFSGFEDIFFEEKFFYLKNKKEFDEFLKQNKDKKIGIFIFNRLPEKLKNLI
ncbi:MAG: hypothetical protein C4347_00900 [Patescibacteria group bacterium]